MKKYSSAISSLLESGNRPVQKTLVWNGIEINLEFLSGDVRNKGKDNEYRLHAHYGYIKGAISYDKGNLDVYVKKLSPNTTLDIFVGHLMTEDKSWDEDKVFIGWETENEIKDFVEVQYQLAPVSFAGFSKFSLEHFKVIAFMNHDKKTILANEKVFNKLLSKKIVNTTIKTPIERIKSL